MKALDEIQERRDAREILRLKIIIAMLTGNEIIGQVAKDELFGGFTDEELDPRNV